MSNQSESAGLGGRLRRYAKVSGAVGGLAARVAGERYLGVSFDRTNHAAELTAALGGLKGPLMKVAQIAATIPDALPKEYRDQLRQLQSNAPAMGWAFVRRRMNGELGADWQSLFSEFGQTAAAAASLGQVHKAVLAEDGATVACKLQYPDMAEAVDADLRQLKLIFSIYERYDKAISTKQIHTELSARLREELDYRREARHLALYQYMLAGETHAHLPEVYDRLSTDRLITMSWLEGKPLLPFIADLADRPDALELRNTIALNMFRAWYIPFYHYGVIHGDPHLGNYTVRPDGDLNLLDFGCIRIFPPAFVQGVIDLYHALRDDDEELAVHAYESWGFGDINKEVIEVLNHWARFLYKPLMEDRVRPIQETDTGEFGNEVVAKVHSELRRINGVQPPREFVLMDRAAVGLGSVFMHLKAEVNWHRLFHSLIADFDPATVAERQNAAMVAVDLPPPA
ncbi:MAG: AarF/ABC1/UbiB kinase family protein [Pseudomonadota bacterium]|nr:AarF/ABC1/UbiB kinase family protein [Pseudomonadota bacterium]